MEKVSLIHLRSVLNDALPALKEEEKAFLGAIDPKGEFLFEDDDKSLPGVFFVQTGGAETQFLAHYQDYESPYLLLVTGRRNSLAASLEILSFLHHRGLEGKIIFGDPSYMHDEIAKYARFIKARRIFRSTRLGVIGHPSDWLIASVVDYVTMKERLGIEIENVDYQEFLDEIENIKEVPDELMERFAKKTFRKTDLYESLRIYLALKEICRKHNLGGFTLRCFDLLNLKHETSCLAFALLNEEGIIAGCEGDVPALISMSLGKALFGEVGFMANPSEFDMETNSAIYAHCTCPFSFITSYTLANHFESGLGFGIRGKIREEDCVTFKINADASEVMALEGHIEENPVIATLCRTQIRVKFADSLNEILTKPHGNHMIFHYGHHKALIKEFFAFLKQ